MGALRQWSGCSLNFLWMVFEWSLSVLWAISECPLSTLWMLSKCALNCPELHWSSTGENFEKVGLGQDVCNSASWCRELLAEPITTIVVTLVRMEAWVAPCVKSSLTLSLSLSLLTLHHLGGPVYPELSHCSLQSPPLNLPTHSQAVQVHPPDLDQNNQLIGKHFQVVWI